MSKSGFVSNVFNPGDPIADKPYVQAPPFFEQIVSAITNGLTSQELFDADENANGIYIDDRPLSLEELVGPEWYARVFLTPSKFLDPDYEILSSAFKRSCFLEPHEIDRFEYEALINGGKQQVDQLMRGTESGMELQRLFPAEFKGDVVELREILGLLPVNSQLDLTSGIFERLPKRSVNKLLRWIQAFPPLHREVIDDKTVICGLENCPNQPERIPGIGFQFRSIRVFDQNSDHSRMRFVPIPPNARIEESKNYISHEVPFEVFANDKSVQVGASPKLDVNFACKKLVISSKPVQIEIFRQVKTLDRPYGSTHFTVNGDEAITLEEQISRAWWFVGLNLLVFITQSDQVYTLLGAELSHLGTIDFSNYGVDCAVNQTLSKLVISSLGPDLIEFDLCERRNSARLSLGEIPQNLWDEILANQYKAESQNSTRSDSLNIKPSILVTPLSHVRWFEYKQEMALLKNGIETVGQLLSLSRDEAIEKGKIRVRDLENLEWQIESLLNSELESDSTGAIRDKIWTNLESKGWVGELGDDPSYELPKIHDPKVLESARLESNITGAFFEGSDLILKLSCGVDIALDSDLEPHAIYVRPWTPISFLQRRFNRTKALDQ